MSKKDNCFVNFISTMIIYGKTGIIKTTANPRILWKYGSKGVESMKHPPLKKINFVQYVHTDKGDKIEGNPYGSYHANYFNDCYPTNTWELSENFIGKCDVDIDHPVGATQFGKFLFDSHQDSSYPQVIFTHNYFIIDSFRLCQKKSEVKVPSQVLLLMPNRVTWRAIEIQGDGKCSDDQPPEFAQFRIEWA